MSLDYFQGFLIQLGVPASAIPEDGRILTPEQALTLLPRLVSSPVTLGNFGGRRMAAHLLMEVATGGAPVTRETLHTRMRRFVELLVVRPDGYLVRPTTGEAVQKVGTVVLATDGTLRAGGFEVGPFYRPLDGHLFQVDDDLEVEPGTLAAGIHEPDDGVMLPVAEGAVLAVVDMVEGLYRLAFHPGETVEGLARLPGVVRELYANAPELWEAFRHKPYAERVRTLSRLTTGALLVVGTSGAGAAKAASWGGKLGQLSVPLLCLSGDGILALRLVAVPVGGAVAISGTALSATYVLHMATAAGQGAGGGWTPPLGGPGKWVMADEHMSPESRHYQLQVSGVPAGWVYRVTGAHEKVDFDGYHPAEGPRGVLIDAKALRYAKHFDDNLDPKPYYKGAGKIVEAAERQVRLANGIPIRWHVAEPRMVLILQKLFQGKGITGIDVVYTPMLP